VTTQPASAKQGVTSLPGFMKISHYEALLLRLAAATTVDVGLLLECDELVRAIKARSSYEDCLRIVNENF
jgi:hypothetical protein